MIVVHKLESKSYLSFEGVRRNPWVFPMYDQAFTRMLLGDNGRPHGLTKIRQIQVPL